MGTRLTWVTVIGVLCVAASSAAAQRPAPAQPPAPVPAPVPPPATAADLAAEGVELYKVGDYGGAVTSLERAHQLEPANFDYEYSLAQALRQASQCDKALLHYQALREAAPDPRTARDVRDQMALCPGGEIEEPAPPPPPPPPPPAATRDGTSTWTNVGLAAAAGGSLTASVLLFLDAGASDDAAVAARSFDEHEHFAARADRMRIASYVTAAAGIGLAVYSIRRFALLKGQRTEVAITPRTDGGAVVFSGSW